MKEALWTIRFANGFLLSHHGTKDEAKTIAERKKRFFGGSYVIV